MLKSKLFTVLCGYPTKVMSWTSDQQSWLEPLQSLLVPPHLDGHEVGTRLVRHSFCQQGFATPRGPEQQNPLGGRQAQRGKACRVPYGLRDGEGQLLPDLHTCTALWDCVIREGG